MGEATDKKDSEFRRGLTKLINKYSRREWKRQMKQDTDNEDYKKGHDFVFDDNLRFSEETKKNVEASFRCFTPFDKITIGVSFDTDPSELTAENKDGYILVRRATFTEQLSYGDLDGEEIAIDEGYAGANADEVEIDGPISRTDVHNALAFFIDIEPEPEEDIDMEEYEARLAHHQRRIDAANRTLRSYGEQIRSKDLADMQEVYYSFSNDARYLGRTMWISVVRSRLSSAWDGIGDWKA